MTNPGSKEPALEPCPLAHPIKEGLNLWSSSAGRKWHIWCHDCGLQFEGRYEQPKEEMIKAWNTRISTDSAGAMVDKEPHCWHCGIVLEATELRPRCDECSADCDEEFCNAFDARPEAPPFPLLLWHRTAILTTDTIS